MQYNELKILAEKLVDMLIKKNYTITAAESCTGGLFASYITSVAGSSECFKGSFVTYSNEMKMKMINVSSNMLQKHGAVSSECVTEMCRGAMLQTSSDISIAISGIAGPSGATPNKPVGTVYIAVLYKAHLIKVGHYIFEGNRDDVRNYSVKEALSSVIKLLEKEF